MWSVRTDAILAEREGAPYHGGSPFFFTSSRTGKEPDSAAWAKFTAFASADVSIERRVERGNVATRVLEVADEIEADLIVLGIEHKPFRDTTILGNDVLRVIRHAEVPVVAVP